MISGPTITGIYDAAMAAETIVGGETLNAVSYHGGTEGVTANLRKGSGSAGWAAGDTYSGIDHLAGSNHNDNLTGNDADNILQGMDGRDRLDAGAGNDILDGGNGNDMLIGGAGADAMVGGNGTLDVADYSKSKGAVTVNLLSGLGGGAADAMGDSYSGIEVVYGSASGDTIIGSDAVNRLLGNAGNDMLSGNGGNDYILGGAGSDMLAGGAGNDTFIVDFFAAAEFDTIIDFAAGASLGDRLWIKNSAFDDFTDVLANIAADLPGLGVILNLGTEGQQVMLQGVTSAQLHADDFLFG